MKLSIRIFKILGFISINNNKQWSILLNNGYRVIVIFIVGYISILGSTSNLKFSRISVRTSLNVSNYFNLIQMAIFVMLTVTDFQFKSAKIQALLTRINQLSSKAIDRHEKQMFIVYLSEFLIYFVSLFLWLPTAGILTLFSTGTTLYQQCVDLFFMSILKILETQFLCLHYQNKSIKLSRMLYETLFEVINLFSPFILYSNIVRVLTNSICLNFFINGNYQLKTLYGLDNRFDITHFVQICYFGTYPIVQTIIFYLWIQACSNVCVQVCIKLSKNRFLFGLQGINYNPDYAWDHLFYLVG